MNTIKAKSYERYVQKKTIFIHRFYLSKELRKRITIQDMSVLEELMIWTEESDEQEKNGCVIEYEQEHMLKFLTPEDVKECVLAFAQYDKDRYENYDLSQDQIQTILELNARLKEIEPIILKDCTTFHDRFVADGWRTHTNPHEHLMCSGDRDFNLDVEIQFYLGEDDPAWDDHDDNIITELGPEAAICTDYNEDCSSVEDDVDYNDKAHLAAKCPVYAMKHCWLFHNLESHIGIPLNYIARIRNFWVDIKVEPQYFIEINK